MFQNPTIIAGVLVVIGSLLGTQVRANHNHANLLAAACKLKDTASAFETINCQRPMTSYTLHQVKALRISTEQFHEAVRCQARPAVITAAFDRVCIYAARANIRFQRSRNFRLDPEWSTAWGCVQNDLEAVRCLLQRPAIAAPSCGVPVGYGERYRGIPYQAVPNSRTPPSHFQVPTHREPPSQFDGRPELLPQPQHQVPSSHRSRQIPNTRTTRNEALQALLLSLLR